MSLHRGLLAALLALPLWSCAGQADNEGELRRQFHIPDDVAIDDVLRTGRTLCNSFGPTITGQARFNAAQFEAYKASMADPALWKPTPLRHFNDDPAAYRTTSEALRWRPFAPIAPGRSGVPGFANAQFVQEAGPGDLLCYVINVPDRNLLGVPEGRGYPDISFESCYARKHWESPGSFVVGHLDPDARMLSMKIKLINLPQYCERARTDASTDLPF